MTDQNDDTLLDPKSEIQAVEAAHNLVAELLFATRGSVYEAFRNTACGLNPDVLAIWWQESEVTQSMGDQSAKAFGCALSVAMMALEADRALRRKDGGMALDGVSHSASSPEGARWTT